ncbi:hypothetical protein [Aquibacillus koreensis]|nr:hypothetical protein [Aquibacillus koreensis]
MRKTDKPDRFSKILNDYKNQVKSPIDTELKNIFSSWLEKQKS